MEGNWLVARPSECVVSPGLVSVTIRVFGREHLWVAFDVPVLPDHGQGRVVGHAETRGVGEAPDQQQAQREVLPWVSLGKID